VDSYVVRIYRRDPKEPRRLTGVVERAGGEDQTAFHDVEELLAILSSQRPNRGIPHAGKNRRKQWDGIK
jgi:hypothetical protein